MGLKIGICGAGQFASCFIPLFQAHPLVRGVALAEIIPDRLAAEAKRFGVQETYGSMDAMLRSDVDAVAILTQRWTHAPLALAALRAGKHVYSAVPAATSLDELAELIDTVKRTGLTYMLGETSYYYPATVYCRERFRAGDFGRFVYGEGEYLHDMSHGFYEAFQYSGGKDWKRTAGYPPMLYPTHSVSMVLSVTGARMTKVSCFGQVDQHEDGIFRVGGNHWDNPFSNQTATFRTSDGGMCRINEFRRVGVGGGRSVRLSFYGTEAAFEEQCNASCFTTRDRKVHDIAAELQCRPLAAKHEPTPGKAMHEVLEQDFHAGLAPAHDKERARLPREFAGLPNGHEGSHQFLVDDFVKACAGGKLPPNHVWAAARYNVPGIIAHESAKRDGELMDIPDFGWPAEDTAAALTTVPTRA